MRVLACEILEVDARKVALNGEATDLGAGSEAQIWLRGHSTRQAGPDWSFASWMSHPIEHKDPERSNPVGRLSVQLCGQCGPTASGQWDPRT